MAPKKPKSKESESSGWGTLPLDVGKAKRGRERDHGIATSIDAKKPRTEEESESSAWASLPRDVGYLILDKLFEPTDHIYFAAVYKQWRYLSEDYNHLTQRWQDRKGNNLLPFFMVVNDKLEAQSVLDEKKRYVIHYPSAYNSYKCCGSSYGWLALYPAQEPLSITLVHPFQKSVAPIHIPFLSIDLKFWGHPHYISKVFFSDDPNLNPHNYIVAALYVTKETTIYGTTQTTKLAIIRVGQRAKWRWTYLDRRQKNIKDAIFHKNQLYAVAGDKDGIVSFDFSDCNKRSKRPRAKLAPKSVPGSSMASGSYLVESINGNHLWQVRELARRCSSSRTHYDREFVVYKVVLDEKDGSVVEIFEVQSIGDEALFLGGVSHSRSVLASNIPGCKRNSIYYTPKDGKPYHIFSLDDRIPTRCECESSSVEFDRSQPPYGVWTLPMLKGLVC